MDRTQPTFLEITLKTIATHTITYMIMGLLASSLLNYASFLSDTSLNVMMKPISSPWVMAGPLFQPLRGLLFGVVFYLLRGAFFGKKNGWLVMWAMLVLVGILSTFGPTPGSVEGLIYTVFPLSVHLHGLPEVLLQSLLLALIVCYWVDHPRAKWLNWVMGVVFVLMMAMPALGLLVTYLQ
jgi:hypothetical protein